MLAQQNKNLNTENLTMFLTNIEILTNLRIH